MDFIKKRKWYFIVPAVLVFLVFGGVRINRQLRWERAKEIVASSGFPVQLGLKNAQSSPCVRTQAGCIPSCIVSGICLAPFTLCAQSVGCTTDTDVFGIQSGGTGNEALFSTASVLEAGFVPGNDVIAAGMAQNFMKIMATPYGCYGCGL